MILCIISTGAVAQCALGQTPTSAFPVCASSIFSQSEVPSCNGNFIPVPCNDGASYADNNAYWYKFTCFNTGPLVFDIVPLIPSDDYDWQLFDVTGVDVSEVYSNTALYVASNWSGNTGSTGTRQNAALPTNCAGTDYETYSKAPQLQKGHSYLLMVSHYTITNQSGYNLSFNASSSAILTDTTMPVMQSVVASCDGYQLTVKFNKKMKCSSILPTGSDFSLLGPLRVISATPVGCTEGFETDSVILQLNDSLRPGYKRLIVKYGKDDNTILDNCDRQIPDSSGIAFEVYERQYTPLDSVSPVKCRPKTVELSFNKNIRCSSISPDGSDFIIDGSYSVKVINAEGRCANGLTKTIKIEMNNRLERDGNFTIRLRRGRDGNTIIDECGEQTPVPAQISFTIKDTVSARFTYTLAENCTNDVLSLSNNGGASITSWAWTVDSVVASTEQNPTLTFTKYGTKEIKLIVTNGFCSDTVPQQIFFPHDSLEAAFNGTTVTCPTEQAFFTDSSVGNIAGWNWQFGNGNSSSLKNPPPQFYYTTVQEHVYPVTLIIRSNKDCFDTAIRYITALKNCYVAVPTAFTPNGDGKNDYLSPLNAYKATGLKFFVYNKYGQAVYSTSDWTKKWDGTINGNPQPTGVYVWMLDYTGEDGKKVFRRGTTLLIR